MQNSPSEHSALRQGVRDLLSQPHMRRETRRCWDEGGTGTPHPATVFRELGARGWLAPHWPQEYGGLGAGPYAAAVVAEKLALFGVPDSARVNTIDNAGTTLLTAGTDEQRSRHLGPMARGESVFAVLYTEPEVGSDLAALTTAAEPSPGGWRLNGVKMWNGRTADSDFAICAARTAADPAPAQDTADTRHGTAARNGPARARGPSKYAEISLFVVPLDHPGVRIEPLDTLNPETLFRVVLDDVEIPPDALVGKPGHGWSLITEALGLERTGICFAGRARRWFDQLVAALDAEGRLGREAARHGLWQLDAELRAARLLSWRAVQDLESGEQNGAAAAGAKWWASELAQQVALLAGELLGPGSPSGGPAERTAPAAGPGGAADAQGLPEAFPDLSVALGEAPGLTLAAGTSPVQLTAVATELLDAGDPWEES